MNMRDLIRLLVGMCVRAVNLQIFDLLVNGLVGDGAGDFGAVLLAECRADNNTRGAEGMSA